MNKAVLEFKVTKENDGKTVENICRRKLDISAKLFKFLKLNGKIKINGRVCRSVDIVADNDILTVDVTENESSLNIVPVKMKLDIVYEDEYIIVVNKPRNMSVHPSMGNFDNTLANGLAYYWEEKGERHKFHAVNRIDKDTSGVCVVAKNQYSHGVLSEQIKSGEFIRKYKAVVHGTINPPEGVIDKPIEREKESVIKRVVSETGKRAVTEYKTIHKSGKYSMVEAFLHTGRTHQIRVHFSYMGNPLVGDWLYGFGDEERDVAKGHLLHAYYAEFYHPKTKERLIFDLSVPDDMKI